MRGVGNGIGAGILLTLGADVAPQQGRAQFLSGWRLMADVGNAAGPALVSLGTVLVSLGAAAVGLGVMGIAVLPLVWCAVVVGVPFICAWSLLPRNAGRLGWPGATRATAWAGAPALELPIGAADADRAQAAHMLARIRNTPCMTKLRG